MTPPPDIGPKGRPMDAASGGKSGGGVTPPPVSDPKDRPLDAASGGKSGGGVTTRTPCSHVGMADVGKTVTVCGWVHRRRDHGGLTFIDVRDRSGRLQVTFNPQSQPEVHTKAHDLRSEYVVQVTGLVRQRPAGTENPKLKTGAVELEATALVVLNPAATPPFQIAEDEEVSEELRYAYRYLDLRRPSAQERFIVRHPV